MCSTAVVRCRVDSAECRLRFGGARTPATRPGDEKPSTSRRGARRRSASQRRGKNPHSPSSRSEASRWVKQLHALATHGRSPANSSEQQEIFSAMPPVGYRSSSGRNTPDHARRSLREERASGPRRAGSGHAVGAGRKRVRNRRNVSASRIFEITTMNERLPVMDF